MNIRKLVIFMGILALLDVPVKVETLEAELAELTEASQGKMPLDDAELVLGYRSEERAEREAKIASLKLQLRHYRQMMEAEIDPLVPELVEELKNDRKRSLMLHALPRNIFVVLLSLIPAAIFLFGGIDSYHEMSGMSPFLVIGGAAIMIQIFLCTCDWFVVLKRYKWASLLIGDFCGRSERAIFEAARAKKALGGNIYVQALEYSARKGKKYLSGYFLEWEPEVNGPRYPFYYSGGEDYVK